MNFLPDFSFDIFSWQLTVTAEDGKGKKFCPSASGNICIKGCFPWGPVPTKQLSFEGRYQFRSSFLRIFLTPNARKITFSFSWSSSKDSGSFLLMLISMLVMLNFPVELPDTVLAFQNELPLNYTVFKIISKLSSNPP